MNPVQRPFSLPPPFAAFPATAPWPPVLSYYVPPPRIRVDTRPDIRLLQSKAIQNFKPTPKVALDARAIEFRPVSSPTNSSAQSQSSSVDSSTQSGQPAEPPAPAYLDILEDYYIKPRIVHVAELFPADIEY